jgi:hypothetical protein
MSESDKNDKTGDVKGLGDIIKRVVSVGVGAAFMTEESVKSLLGDLPIPKDVITGLVTNAKGAKEEFTKSLREEFRKYLSKLDTEKLIDYILQNYDVEFNANVSFKKKDSDSDRPKSAGDAKASPEEQTS